MNHNEAVYLGIDFGTTNTAVCHIQGNEPRELSFGHNQVERYVPSVVVKTARKNYYGWEAKTRIGQPGQAVYQNFKMLLGERPEVVSQHWGHTDVNPQDIAGEFIGVLMQQIREEYRITPTGVVITAPEVWLKQNLQARREHLIRCFRAQQIPGVAVHSEPVAAGGYYLHCFQQKYGKPFTGHLLICDCGGGTMDFCLVQVEGGANGRPGMSVLERSGDGMVGTRIGSAGVAFDMGVVERLLPGLKVENATRFFRRLREFEEFKILNRNDLSEHLALYRETPEMLADEPLFHLEDTPVMACDLVDVFNTRIRPGIEQALTEMTAQMQHHHIDCHDSDRFRVLMVGGFSSFYLVQETIRSAFGNVTSTDRRFEDIFSRDDRSLAIAKGAVLIAGDLIEVIDTCPVDVGIVGYAQQSDGTMQRIGVRILQKAVKIETYHQPIWARQSFQIANTGAAIPIYLEPVPGHPFDLDIKGNPLKKILPPGAHIGTTVEVGFSVDENLIFSIHVRDADKRKQTTTLGDLMGMMDQLPAFVMDNG